MTLEEAKKHPSDIITGYCEIDDENLYKDLNYPIIPDVDEMDTYMKNLGFLNSKIIEDHGKNNQVDKIYWK